MENKNIELFFQIVLSVVVIAVVGIFIQNIIGFILNHAKGIGWVTIICASVLVFIKFKELK
ncbi:hypothetical protein Xen7305DRAFT_00000640 [Xenococcus sp. PCC 7305]|uniref:hypothetical protein n=1 Tax=Xenococcus sp. PCC 7305 TaxID=102125 RepID=UPI0002ACFA66|nr:hypothetical protein [Xenococcus sp. PCC 7305]ELS00364.1 hypothetical protein Xen7305DRAFT_00000640 [Xenococcus sp. PCC 7305]